MSPAPTTDGFTENGLPVGPHGIAEPTLPPRGGARYRIQKRQLYVTPPPGDAAYVVPVRPDTSGIA